MSQLYLTRIRLRQGAPRDEAFWRQLGQGDSHHRLVWRFFAKEEQGRDFLYRVDGAGTGLVIYTLSRRQPRDDSGFWQIDEPRPFAPALTPGQPLDFILRANPVRRSMRNPSDTVRGRMERRAGKHSNSSDQKHDVVMLEKRRLQEAGLPALDEPELVQSQGEAWLRQQEKSSGFEVVRVRADGYQQQRIFRRGAPASFSTIEFSGLLRVTDPAQMKQRLWFGTEGPAEARVSPGLGSARGFGCGLMLVRRPAAPWAGGADDEDDG